MILNVLHVRLSITVAVHEKTRKSMITIVIILQQMFASSLKELNAERWVKSNRLTPSLYIQYFHNDLLLEPKEGCLRPVSNSTRKPYPSQRVKQDMFPVIYYAQHSDIQGEYLFSSETAYNHLGYWL